VLKSTLVCSVPLALIAAVLAPGRADACGALPPASYTIGAVSPSPGSTGVARNTGVVVTGVPSSPSGGGAFADVELIDADTDEAVPLASVAWFPFEGAENTMAVHPMGALVPLHAYRIEARPLDEEGAPGEPFISSFTTSEALLEPLELAAELQLSLRGADVDIVASGPCGDPGVVTGKRRALLADVRLPVPSGGQGVYQGALHFSDRTPTRVGIGDPLNSNVSGAAERHEVRVVQWIQLESGQGLTLEQEIFEEGTAYAGCFTFIVWDPAGHGAQTSACLPSLSPDDVRALAQSDEPLDIAANDAIAASTPVRRPARPRGSRCCSHQCSRGASRTARAGAPEARKAEDELDYNPSRLPSFLLIRFRGLFVYEQPSAGSRENGSSLQCARR
jgi:hypothetical protein